MRAEPKKICANCKYANCLSDNIVVCERSMFKSRILLYSTCSKYKHREKGEPKSL